MNELQLADMARQFVRKIGAQTSTGSSIRCQMVDPRYTPPKPEPIFTFDHTRTRQIIGYQPIPKPPMVGTVNVVAIQDSLRSSTSEDTLMDLISDASRLILSVYYSNIREMGWWGLNMGRMEIAVAVATMKTKSGKEMNIEDRVEMAVSIAHIRAHKITELNWFDNNKALIGRSMAEFMSVDDFFNMD